MFEANYINLGLNKMPILRKKTDNLMVDYNGWSKILGRSYKWVTISYAYNFLTNYTINNIDFKTNLFYF